MPESLTFRFSFEELGLSRSRIERVMGYETTAIPEPFPEIIDDVLANASHYCTIEGGFSIFDAVSFRPETFSLSIGKENFEIHRIVFHQLKYADKIAVFACTAGPAIGEWSKALMSSGDLMKGYVVDVVGSETVESAMDKVQESLLRYISATGLRITNRYSPGYCGWLVSEQFKLFSLLPPRFCSITLSDSALMYPIKSVSGMIGIGEKVHYHDYSCGLCDSKNCLYRNRKS